MDKNYKRNNPRPKPHTELLTIKKTGINGEGVAYLDKKITFIRGALPGETVEVALERREDKYNIGRLVKIVEESPLRTRPKCREQKHCLGCPLMNFNYEGQLETKKNFVHETFMKFDEKGYNEEMLQDIVNCGQQYSLKNIVRLPVTHYDGKTIFGIYQRDSKYLTRMSGCPMQSKSINTTLKAIEDLCGKHKLRAYSDHTCTGFRFLTIKEYDEGQQLIFVTGLDRLPEAFIKDVKALENVVSVYLTINTTRKQDFEDQRYEDLSKHGDMKQIFMQKEFTIPVKAEFPEYRLQAITSAKKTAALIDETATKLLEAGCGIGLNLLGLDEKYMVHGIDKSSLSIRTAEANALSQGRENAHFEYGDMEKIFTQLSKKYHYDTVIVNVDNFNVDDAFIKSLIASKTPQLLLKGKHISQLAKTTNLLHPYYRTDTITPLDAMPQTAQVEAIVCMHYRR